MKEIKLTQGKVAFVDDEDFEFLSQWKWSFVKYRKYEYAVRSQRQGNKILGFKMHRVLMNVIDPKIFVDHEDHNGLNNQKGNLRICDNQKNQWNGSSCSSSKSQHRGVSFFKKGKRTWRATIMINGKNKYLGSFENEGDAAKAYNDAAVKRDTIFHKLNIV